MFYLYIVTFVYVYFFLLNLPGEVGSATKLTLVHNMLMGTMVAALAESIALADSVNVDLNVLQHIFDISPSLTSIIQSKTYGTFLKQI